ncbi:MAG TPA: hypothetical protein VNZ06_06645, partial [Steroidobacteraceae bacterium]|nr:hypothetical protein [Steroidobacteraceae bacterium]
MQIQDRLVRSNAIQSFLAAATDAEIVWQLTLVGVVIVLGMLASGYARRWRARHLAAMPLRGLRSRLIEISAIEAPFVLCLIVLLVGRTVVAAIGSPLTLLDVALQLVTALILVRLALYLLRLALGPRSWLRTWETRLTLLVWLGISFELVGWFGEIEKTLDEINLLPGAGRFTLWALLKGLVIITAFVLVTSVIARGIERRVMHIEAIALSTRIGITKFTYFFLVGLGVLLGINAAGVDLTALTVLTGAIGLGLGFGLQSIASNFV